MSTLPRVSTPPSAESQRIPVAHRTWARLAPPQLSSLVELVEYHVPTAKTTRKEPPNSNHFAGLCQALGLSAPEESEFAGLCEKLTILDKGDALAVLNRDSGKLLEHRQLRNDPCYKTVWDRLYANELGRLCQCQTLIDMGWPQPRSPIQTNNSTAIGVTNKTIVPKRAKMMDMRLWWLQCRGSQKQFCYSITGMQGLRIGPITVQNTIQTFTTKPTDQHVGIWNIPPVSPLVLPPQ